MNARQLTPNQCAMITLAVSLVCIVGDYYLKRASQAPRPFSTWEFFAGTIIFGLSGVGWVIVLPSMKMASVGTVYGVSTVLFMAVLGVSSSVKDWPGRSI
jgi:hypothetical protein